MKKFYLDTAIWRDYYENRNDGLRPLGEWAFQLFQKIIEEDSAVLYSEVVEEEFVSLGFNEDKINDILSIVKAANLINVKPTEKQFDEAKMIVRQRNLPFRDVLHAILARDNGAVMVTRDHHFEELQDITKPSKPEDLI